MKNEIDQLNELLRGELSAIETYRQATESLKSSPHISKIQEMETDHKDAAEKLKTKIVEHGATPVETSGPWGVWAKAVTGVATMISEAAVLKTLKEGEEHGMKEYRELEKIDLNSFGSTFLSERYTKQTRHIETLDGFLSSQN